MYFMYMICTYLLPEKITYQKKNKYLYLSALLCAQFLVSKDLHVLQPSSLHCRQVDIASVFVDRKCAHM